MSTRPILKLVAEKSIARCASSNRENGAKPLTFPNDGSVQAIDIHRAGLTSLNAPYKELRAIWGRTAFEGTRNCYSNLKARCRDGYSTLDEDFELTTFMEALGPRPSLAHSVDRIDNSSGYSTKNIRWATKAEQARNRSSTSTYLLDGYRHTLQEAAALGGVSPREIRARRSAGMSDERAVFGTRPRSRCDGPVGKITFTPTEAQKWKFGTLVQALSKSKSLGHDEQLVAINELVRRKLYAEDKFEACYVPEEYDPTPHQVADMERWAGIIQGLAERLMEVFPDINRRYLRWESGYYV